MRPPFRQSQMERRRAKQARSLRNCTVRSEQCVAASETVAAQRIPQQRQAGDACANLCSAIHTRPAPPSPVPETLANHTELDRERTVELALPIVRARRGGTGGKAEGVWPGSDIGSFGQLRRVVAPTTPLSCHPHDGHRRGRLAAPNSRSLAPRARTPCGLLGWRPARAGSQSRRRKPPGTANGTRAS